MNQQIINTNKIVLTRALKCNYIALPIPLWCPPWAPRALEPFGLFRMHVPFVRLLTRLEKALRKGCGLDRCDKHRRCEEPHAESREDLQEVGPHARQGQNMV